MARLCKRGMLTALLIAFMIAGSAPLNLVYAVSIGTVIPGSGSNGDTIVVTGSGVTAGVQVNVYWDAIKAWDGEKGLLNSTEAEPSGDYEVWFDVPQATAGTHNLWVKDMDTGLTTSASFTVLPMISTSPSRGLPGDRITIKGYGFSKQAQITSIMFDGEDLTTSPTLPETDTLGSWTATFLVPDKPYGTYPMYAEDEFTVSATADFTVGPVIAFNVNSGPVGSVVRVYGRGFTIDGVVDSIMIDSTPCTTTGTINIDTVGRFTGELVIPSVSAVGVYEITVTDDVGLQGSNSFEVTGLSRIRLDPPYGPQGSSVNIYGYNFTAIAGEPVYTELWDAALTSKIADLRTYYTDSGGEFGGTFTVPVVESGSYRVVARQDDWNIYANRPFLVRIILVILSPTEGPVGTEVRLTGTGFTPAGEWNAMFGDIVIFYEEDVEVDGTIDGTFNVPMVDPGTYTVSVLDVFTEIEVTTWFEVIGEPVLGSWATVTPLIDGRISDDEWDDADSIQFVLEYGNEAHGATLFVKNDYTNLYIAAVIEDDDTHPSDTLTYYFDNDNDGTPEAGDDILEMRNMIFSDMHIFDPVNILEGLDTSADGVGDSTYTYTEVIFPNYWSFEIVHPLNSADDSQDFSLTIGDDVGFYMEYWDQDAGAADAWPTPTWPGMATIVIEEPPEPPVQYEDVDVVITDIEVTQAVQDLDNSMPLVRWKDTLVRVHIDTGSRPSTWWMPVTVYLYALDGVTRQTLGPLTETITGRSNPDRGIVSHTANFLLPIGWINRDSTTFRAFAKGPDAYGESDFDNNWMMVDGSPELTLPFQETTAMTIHLVPINIAPLFSPVQFPSQQEMDEQEEYLRAIYPLADVNILHTNVWIQLPFLPSVPWPIWTGSLDDLIDDLNTLAGNLGVSPPDQVFGLLPAAANTGGVSDPPWWDSGLGVAACGSRGGSTSLEGVMAHEIIHNLGPGTDTTPYRGWGMHTFDDADWPYANNNINEYGATAVWGWPPLIIPPTKPEIMSYTSSAVFPTKWISPYRWENMFNFFHTTSTSTYNTSTQESPMDSLQISGWVSRGGEGSLKPVFRLQAPPLQPARPGTCSVELQDPNGNVLLAKSFEPSFVNVEGGERDPYRFTMFLPYQPGTARVVLKWNDVVLDAIQMSGNPPVVTVASPNGGETITGVHTITWNGMDLDGDPLKYMVKYSSDGGTTWTPLVMDTDATSCDYDFSKVAGSDTALIRVITTDGFNTAVDESDGPFKVGLKAPEATILRPLDGSGFLTHDVIVFRGRGYDLEDGQLPDDAFSWSSDVDGPLGVGEALDVRGFQLTPGTHLISLTVMDSDGMEDTDTVSIRVLMPWGPATVEAYAPWLGAALDEFKVQDDVYCRGEGYKPDDVVDVYLVEDVDVWTSGIDLKGLNVVRLVEDVRIDRVGNLQSTLVWAGPLTVGNYDLIVDVDKDGFYVAGVDALDDNGVKVTSGLFVIPELPLGTLISLLACLAALATSTFKREDPIGKKAK